MITIEVKQQSESIVTVQDAVEVRLKGENGNPDRAYAIVIDSSGNPALEEIINE